MTVPPISDETPTVLDGDDLEDTLTYSVTDQSQVANFMEFFMKLDENVESITVRASSVDDEVEDIVVVVSMMFSEHK